MTSRSLPLLVCLLFLFSGQGCKKKDAAADAVTDVSATTLTADTAAPSPSVPKEKGKVKKKKSKKKARKERKVKKDEAGTGSQDAPASKDGLAAGQDDGTRAGTGTEGPTAAGVVPIGPAAAASAVAAVDAPGSTAADAPGSTAGDAPGSTAADAPGSTAGGSQEGATTAGAGAAPAPGGSPDQPPETAAGAGALPSEGADNVVRTPEDPAPGAAAAGAVAPGTETPPAGGTLPPPPVRLAMSRLLSIADLNQHLADKGWMSYGSIPGIDPSELYNSIIYRKPGTIQFVSLQAYDFDQYALALEKWNELFSTQPNAKELKGMFVPNLFFSYRNQVNALTFLEPDRAMVLILSCHKDVCSDTALYNLATSVHARAR